MAASPETLRKLLRYEPDTGKLFWRKRTPDMFSGGYRSPEGNCSAWNARFAGKEAFAFDRGNGYLSGGIFGVLYAAHRVIWAMHHGKWPDDQIDHINGDRTDNRISNIRSVSQAENGKNMKRPSTNTSGVIGVTWDKQTEKWRSGIRVDGKKKCLGRFQCKTAASIARLAAERRYGFHENHGRIA